MSHTREPTANFSYMDGIPVKISEKYKPPRKVSLPIGFQHHFSYELLNEDHDFRLERSVLEKMGEWRILRKAAADSRKERIKLEDEACQEKLNEDLQNFSMKSTELPPTGAENSSSCPDSRRSSNDDPQSSGKSLSKSVPDIVQELEKELAEKRVVENNAASGRVSHTPPPRPNSFGSTGLEDWKPWPDLDSPDLTQSKNKKSPAKVSRRKDDSSLSNPFHELSESSKKLAKHISEMGFYLPRVARACQMFEDDDKKVVEFLLQVQSVEEKNWPGDLAEKAVVANGNDVSEALKFLEAFTQLLDLGFPEDKVTDALVKFNNDRDKALDYLIS